MERHFFVVHMLVGAVFATSLLVLKRLGILDQDVLAYIAIAAIYAGQLVILFGWRWPSSLLLVVSISSATLIPTDRPPLLVLLILCALWAICGVFVWIVKSSFGKEHRRLWGMRWSQ